MGSRASNNYTLEPSLGREERERERERERDEGEGERNGGLSSLRFDRVGVDRRLIDSPPRHGNFFEEPAGLPFFCNTYHLAERAVPSTLPSPPSFHLTPSSVCSRARAHLLFEPRRRFDDPTMTYSFCTD